MWEDRRLSLAAKLFAILEQHEVGGLKPRDRSPFAVLHREEEGDAAANARAGRAAPLEQARDQAAQVGRVDVDDAVAHKPLAEVADLRLHPPADLGATQPLEGRSRRICPEDRGARGVAVVGDARERRHRERRPLRFESIERGEARVARRRHAAHRRDPQHGRLTQCSGRDGHSCAFVLDHPALRPDRRLRERARPVRPRLGVRVCGADIRVAGDIAGDVARQRKRRCVLSARSEQGHRNEHQGREKEPCHAGV